MIVTKSWLSEWIDLKGISTDDLAKTFNSIGLEVDRVKTYDVPSKIVVGRVLECEKHPDADKLNVCKVDIGSSVRQIVCGALNVRAGLDVVVATVGAVMPSGMAIKPVKLRGVDSEGMICSASEIGFENIGNGIVELDNSIGEYELGQEVSTIDFFSDELIEIELTANRGDCLSIRGVARDLSAAYNRPIIVKNINKDEEKRVGIGRILSLSHENHLDVNLRYKAVDLKEFKLPLLVKMRLAQIEESAETDLEALMLYVTQSCGVILRAYDYEFFHKEDETVAKIELKKDKNTYASIFHHENKASTVGVSQEDASRALKDEGIVLLEASYIPPDVISRKMQEKKVKSDSVYYRTSRGSEPELDRGLDFCLNFIESNSSSLVYGGSLDVCDVYDEKVVSVTKQEVDEIIGASIDRAKIINILKNLGFDTKKSTSEKFVIGVPRYRHDIVNKQDIVEEIVRLVGIDNIPSKPFVFAESSKLKDDYFDYKKKTFYRHKAAQSGFFEAIAFVFDEKKVLQKYGFETIEGDKEILNPIVNTLDTLRPTLMSGLLKAASNNVKNGISSIRLFEVGSVFNPQREESLKMALLFSGDAQNETLANGGKPQKIDFASFVQKVTNIIGRFELREYQTAHKLSHPYQCAEILQDGVVLGELFRLHPEVQKEYDLADTFMCEFDFSKLPYALKTAKVTSKYQASFRDLSIVMPKDMSYESVKNVIDASNIAELVRFYPVDRYSDESLGENMSLSIRFVLQSDDKTLSEEDITSAMQSILDALDSKLGIGLR
jgi:phenylalanyl-tRNA synthetase beta chain